MALSLPHFTFQIVRTFRLSLQIKPKISAFIVLHRRVQCIFQRAPYTVAVVWIYINYMHFEVTNTKKTGQYIKRFWYGTIWRYCAIGEKEVIISEIVCVRERMLPMCYSFGRFEQNYTKLRCNVTRKKKQLKERKKQQWMNEWNYLYINIAHIVLI